jgi:chromosome segregation ATPase
MVTGIVAVVSLLLIGFLAFRITELQKQVKMESSGHMAVKAERDGLLDVKKDLIEANEILNQRIDSLQAINRNVNERRTDLENEIKRLNSHIVRLEDVVDTRNKQIEAFKDKVAALENPPALLEPFEVPSVELAPPTPKKRIGVTVKKKK